MKRFARYCKKSIFNVQVVCIFLCVFGLSACDSPSKEDFSGYVEGRYTYISSLFSGTLKSLLVTPGMDIKASQVLFTLEPLPTKMDVTIAQANIQAALNEIKKIEFLYMLEKINYNRNVILLKKDIISKEEFENSTMKYHQTLADRNIALARLESLKAEEKKALWEMSQKKAVAPKDMVVFDTYYTEGENISAGSPVLSLLDVNEVRIIFFIPEVLLSQLHINQPIKVTYDGAKAPVEAKITYISTKATYNPPIIYSKEERQRLVFRVEAASESKNGLKVYPGQPVSITLVN